VSEYADSPAVEPVAGGSTGPWAPSLVAGTVFAGQVVGLMPRWMPLAVTACDAARVC
jgi:hypothetical protein